MSLKQSTRTDNKAFLSDRERKQMIGYELSSLDPIMYAVMDVIVSDSQDDKDLDYRTLDSIYDYFEKILNTISIRGLNKKGDILRDGNRLMIDTHLDAEHLNKLKHLSIIFEQYANELDGSGGGYIINKFLNIDGTIVVVFDVVDTSSFDYDSGEDLKQFLQPYLDNLC